jgi:predicted DNA-binding protein (MmcQ/YjbR family)
VDYIAATLPPARQFPIFVGHAQELSVKNDLHEAVRAVCLWLPETDEVSSHGSPNFRVRGKTFATFVVNHHGDGRVALWLNVPRGAQDWYVSAASRQFFVPPYVGSRGWLGVHLDKGLSWKRIALLVREAYEKVAPAVLKSSLGETPRIRAPARRLARADIDPLQSPRGKSLLRLLRTICASLPETREVTQFGSPVWQAGTKSFLWARCDDRRLTLWFWVGVDRQALLTADQRFKIPPYMGHNGWISLDVTEARDAAEIAALVEPSYRHFALKRMRVQWERTRFK